MIDELIYIYTYIYTYIYIYIHTILDSCSMLGCIYLIHTPPTTPRHAVHPDIYKKKLLFSMFARYTNYMFTYCFLCMDIFIKPYSQTVREGSFEVNGKTITTKKHIK